MGIGIIKWYDPTKKFGFIKTSQGENDLFFHASALDNLNIKVVRKENFTGIRVKYELIQDLKGRDVAIDIKLVNDVTTGGDGVAAES
jgi:cold shock protein